MFIHHVQTHLVRCVLALFVLVCFSVSTHAAEQDEYSVFLSGFTAFQNQEYQGAASKMSQFLKDYPDTPLRDMALFWLARAHFRLGEKQEAARCLALFLKEYPDTPLRSAAEPELIALAESFDGKGDSLIARTAEKPVTLENLELFPEQYSDTPLRDAVKPELVAHAQRDDEKNDSLIVRVTEKPTAEAKEQKTSAASSPAVKSFSDQAQTGQVDDGKPPGAGADVTPEITGPTLEMSSLSMKDQAIREYRLVLDKYPGTQAALTAAERLKALQQGDIPPVRQVERIAETNRMEKSATTLTLEVGQFAAADLSLRRYTETCVAGVNVSVPFEVVNRGNGPDSFELDAGLPAEYMPRIASAAHPEAPLTSTPSLAPGESFAGMVAFTVPSAIIDGQRSLYPIKMVSKFDPDISVSKEIPLVFSAPLLRMVVKPDKEIVLPGEVITYRMALLNLGSATAKQVSFSLSYPSHYEPIGPLPAGFRREGRSHLAVDQMEVGSGRRKEFNVVFRLKDDALAGQQLFCRAEVNNSDLKLTEAFLSSPAAVGKVSGVVVKVQNDRRTVLPGQKVVIPVSVSNSGNFLENLTIKTSIPSSIHYVMYRNDGSSIKQTDEVINGSINSLSPGEEASLRIELFAPAKVSDKTEMSFTVTCETASAPNKSATASMQLVYSRPVVTLEMEAKNERLMPGEIAHLILSAINNGSSMAKDVEVLIHLPASIDVVASKPVAFEGKKGEHLWRFPELGPGEKRSIVLAYRIRPGVTAGTNLQIENQFRYKDQQGNLY